MKEGYVNGRGVDKSDANGLEKEHLRCVCSDVAGTFVTGK